MIYHLVINKEGNRTSVFEDENKEKVRDKLNKKYTDKRYRAKIIGIPEIEVGLRLYKEDNYYKTIIGETNSLFYLDNEYNDNPNRIPDPTRKESIMSWFINEIVTPDVDEYGKDYDKYFVHMDNKDLEDEEDDINNEEPDN